MAIHSSILVWRIPWTGEPGGLPSMGSQRIGHNLSNIACTRNSYGFARGKFWLYVKQNWFEKALIKVFVFITSLLFLFGEYEPIFLKGEIKKKTIRLCCCLVTQSCLCDLMDCSPPGFSVHGISQAKII